MHENRGGALFDIETCTLDSLSSFAGIAEEMLYLDGLDGLVVRGAFPPECAATAAHRLLTPHDDLVRCEIPTHELHRGWDFEDTSSDALPYVVCRDLISSPLDQIAYFDSALRFRRGCRRLFRGGPDFQERVEAVLRVLGGNRAVDVPRGPAGQPYAHATARIWTAGHEIGIHCGLEILTVPGYAPVRELVDVTGQLSYFVLLQAPASGGALFLHDVRFSQLDADRRIDGWPVEIVAAMRASIPIQLVPGDLVIFDGGRIFHRVSVVGEGPNRITIGGFVALGPDHQTVLYWN